MRTHGWGGDPPASDEEAVARIVAATRRCIDEHGVATSTALVAESLGVTRQTVYRYFASTDDLLAATAIDATGAFLDRLAVHVAGISDPNAALVEAVAFALEEIPGERYLSFLLLSGKVTAFAKGVTSPTALAFGRSILMRFPVEWAALGYDEALMEELTEYVLRLLQSFLFDPGDPQRTGAELRDFLGRWITLPQVASDRDGAASSLGSAR